MGGTWKFGDDSSSSCFERAGCLSLYTLYLSFLFLVIVSLLSFVSSRHPSPIRLVRAIALFSLCLRACFVSYCHRLHTFPCSTRYRLRS
ncbi:hypothetical protein B0T14DRAFT_329789 [Immersiella caudata]|uniref:Uncharacterized protein n=1 Tax=Immersiella caudata TaxID=314043 RepID=A0AA39U5J2_9PEZI|nr:hypothetical protein B0T14DRAFT_329789 [Immersiella caudata]